MQVAGHKDAQVAGLGVVLLHHRRPRLQHRPEVQLLPPQETRAVVVKFHPHLHDAEGVAEVIVGVGQRHNLLAAARRLDFLRTLLSDPAHRERAVKPALGVAQPQDGPNLLVAEGRPQRPRLADRNVLDARAPPGDALPHPADAFAPSAEVARVRRCPGRRLRRGLQVKRAPARQPGLQRACPLRVRQRRRRPRPARHVRHRHLAEPNRLAGVDHAANEVKGVLRLERDLKSPCPRDKDIALVGRVWQPHAVQRPLLKPRRVRESSQRRGVQIDGRIHIDFRARRLLPAARVGDGVILKVDRRRIPRRARHGLASSRRRHAHRVLLRVVNHADGRDVLRQPETRARPLKGLLPAVLENDLYLDDLPLVPRSRVQLDVLLQPTLHPANRLVRRRQVAYRVGRVAGCQVLVDGMVALNRRLADGVRALLVEHGTQPERPVRPALDVHHQLRAVYLPNPTRQGVLNDVKPLRPNLVLPLLEPIQPARLRRRERIFRLDVRVRRRHPLRVREDPARAQVAAEGTLPRAAAHRKVHRDDRLLDEVRRARVFRPRHQREGRRVLIDALAGRLPQRDKPVREVIPLRRRRVQRRRPPVSRVGVLICRRTRRHDLPVHRRLERALPAHADFQRRPPRRELRHERQVLPRRRELHRRVRRQQLRARLRRQIVPVTAIPTHETIVDLLGFVHRRRDKFGLLPALHHHGRHRFADAAPGRPVRLHRHVVQILLELADNVHV